MDAKTESKQPRFYSSMKKAALEVVDSKIKELQENIDVLAQERLTLLWTSQSQPFSIKDTTSFRMLYPYLFYHLDVNAGDMQDHLKPVYWDELTVRYRAVLSKFEAGKVSQDDMAVYLLYTDACGVDFHTRTGIICSVMQHSKNKVNTQ